MLQMETALLFTIVIAAIVLVYVIKLFLDYRKVAVKTKGYPVIKGLTLLFLAFAAVVGAISLPDQLLMKFLAWVGLDPEWFDFFTKNRWYLLAAYTILAFAIIVVLKEYTKSLAKPSALNYQQGVENIQVGRDNVAQQINFFQDQTNEAPIHIEYFIEELRRKNKEIDALREVLAESLSPNEKLSLSTQINQLQTEKTDYEQKTKALEKKLNAYSQDTEIVSKVSELLEADGFETALDYLQSIDFDAVMGKSVEYAKAALIQAELHVLNNQHAKADAAYLKSIALHRNFDNTLDYANYLFKQKEFPRSINQLTLLRFENTGLPNENLATLLEALANANQQINEPKEAEKAYDEALEIYQNLAKQNPSAYLPDVATTLNNLAVLYRSDNRLTDAKKAYDEALEIRRNLAKKNPGAYLPYVAMTLNNLAILYGSDNRLTVAEKACVEALEIYQNFAKQYPGTYRPKLAGTLINLANLYDSNNRLTDAEKAYNEALEIYRNLAKQNPGAYLPYVAKTLNNLTELYSSDNRLSNAKKAYDEALEIRRDLAKQAPGAYGLDYANTLVMGVDLLGQDKESLSTAKVILQRYKAIPKAKQLLSRIAQLEHS